MQLAQVLRFPDSVSTLPSGAWDRLIPAAAEQSLLPALHSYLPGPAHVPSDVYQVVKAAASLNAERNSFIVDEAVNVARLLNQINIQPVALKGIAYLLADVYPDPAARYLLDVDLLLPMDQLARAVAHLKQNGYLENESGRLMNFRHHYPSLRREEGPQIEIHHRVGQGICARLLPTAEILSSAQPLAFDGATFLIPSPTNLVNHLILHSQLAHRYHDRISPPLRALVDLVRLQQHFGDRIEWPALAKTYRDCGQSVTLALHLKHAHYVFGFQIPNPHRLTFLDNLRWQRRLTLNCSPDLRFIDPIYLVMSLFSRRIRLLPQILRSPSSWPQVTRLLTDPEFYRNLFTL